MKLEVIDDPDKQLVEFLEQKIREFNWQNWEVKERLPLAVQLKNDVGEVVAGAAARTFGDWLLLDTLWVSEDLRGQNVGTQLLQQIEASAKQRGCDKCLLNTLNFQAMPFYKKHGYKVEWIQPGYPKEGCKYYMSKAL